jgi:MOSC domain-containing protein YiiM
MFSSVGSAPVPETCEECGFDGAKWRPRDEESLLRALKEWAPFFGPVPDDAHDASHWMMDLSRALAPHRPTQQGTVTQVNASRGGVPKTPMLAARIGADGLEGDRQADRRHHGRQFQALCLWSADVIDELKAQGHPIAPGSAGENLTIAGVDWSLIRPGAIVRIGEAAEAEISFDATPCKKQAQWFSDGDFRRIAIERNPQWVRWYAWVRRPGPVQPGDPVVIQ